MIFISILGVSLISSSTLFAQSANSPGKKQAGVNPASQAWMKCVAIADSVSATQNSNAPSAPVQSQKLSMEIVFTQEPGNGDEISADVFSVDAQGKKIKQIAHSELLSGNQSDSLVLQAAPDSPFQFSISLQQQDQSSAPQSAPVQQQPVKQNANGSGSSRMRVLSGSIQSLGLFTGQSVSQAQAKCRYFGTANQASKSQPQPSPSSSPAAASQL